MLSSLKRSNIWQRCSSAMKMASVHGWSLSLWQTAPVFILFQICSRASLALRLWAVYLIWGLFNKKSVQTSSISNYNDWDLDFHFHTVCMITKPWVISFKCKRKSFSAYMISTSSEERLLFSYCVYDRKALSHFLYVQQEILIGIHDINILRRKTNET